MARSIGFRNAAGRMVVGAIGTRRTACKTLCCEQAESLFDEFRDCCDFRIVWIRHELIVRAYASCAGTGQQVVFIGGRCYSPGANALVPRSQLPNGAVLFDDIAVPIECDVCSSPRCRTPCPVDCCVYDWLPVCFDTVPRSTCCQMGQTVQVRYTTRVQNHDTLRDVYPVPPGFPPCPDASHHFCNGSEFWLGNVVAHFDTNQFCDSTFQFDCFAGPVCITASSSYNQRRERLVRTPGVDCPATTIETDPEINEAGFDCAHACVTYGGNDGPVFPRLEIDFEDHNGLTSCVGGPITRTEFEPDGVTIARRVTFRWSYQYGCLSGTGHYEVLEEFFFCGVLQGTRQRIYDRTYEISPGQPCIGTCQPRAPLPPGASRFMGAAPIIQTKRWRIGTTRDRAGIVGAGDFL